MRRRSLALGLPLSTLLIVAGLTGCAQSQSALPPTAAARADNLLPEVREVYGDFDGAAQVAHSAGYEYFPLIARCLGRDAAALHELFTLTHKAHFEGDTVDEHAAVLGGVLRDVGERFFTAGLVQEGVGIQNEVRQYVAWDFGYETQEQFEYVRSLYPHLFPDAWRPADYEQLPASDAADDEDPNAPEDEADAMRA